MPKGGKSQTLVLIGPSVNIDTETQEISADFSGCPDDDDDDEGPRNDNIAIKKASFVGDVASTEVLRWGRPGSLIPSRVTGAVFGYLAPEKRKKNSFLKRKGGQQTRTHAA